MVPPGFGSVIMASNTVAEWGAKH